MIRQCMISLVDQSAKAISVQEQGFLFNRSACQLQPQLYQYYQIN